MNRTYDLKKVMPCVIEAASYSPPVEIAILDYNSQDDLVEYIDYVIRELKMDGCYISYKKYDGRDHYHMAHARNLSVLASRGEYAVISSADIIVADNYFAIIREAVLNDNIWMHHKRRFVGVITVERDEFIDAGGFDERFEFYGKEDKDLLLRLKRRGKKHKQLPTKLLSLIPTPKEDKFKNYRLGVTRQQMGKIAKRIYEENIENEVLVANAGKEWGQWE